MDNLLAKKNSKINNHDLIMKRISSIDIDIYQNIIMDNYGVPIVIDDTSTKYILNSYQYLSVKKLNDCTNFITVKNFDNSDQNLIK